MKGGGEIRLGVRGMMKNGIEEQGDGEANDRGNRRVNEGLKERYRKGQTKDKMIREGKARVTGKNRL